jgi:ABC-2 type transport system permease protein
MSWRIIKTLFFKDTKLFFRDKFFGVMTIGVTVMYIVFYILMPSTIDETIKIGVYTTETENSTLLKNIKRRGLILQQMQSEDELKQAILDRKLHLAIAMHPVDSTTSAIKQKIFVYYSSDLPEEMKEMYTVFIREMVNQISGFKLKITPVLMVLGPDMGGKQIPYKNRILPLFAFMLLVMETMGLANIISTEVESGMIPALLATPMKVTDLFAAKGLTGVILAFSPAAFILIFTGSLSNYPVLILLTLLLGSSMVNGLAFFIASISKDMMSVIGWGVLIVICLIIPGFVMIFPGMGSDWIKIIPSYFLMDILFRAINFDIGWSGNLLNIMWLLVFNLIFISLGIFSLKRKLA